MQIRTEICPRSVLACVVVALLLPVHSCEKKESKKRSDQTRDQRVGEEPMKKKSHSEPGDATGWRKVSPKQAREAMGSQFEKAKRAQQTLGKNLKKALQSSLAEKSFPETVEFCQSTAPKLSKQVAKSMNVEIGRTSHKLRNPKNTPPAWAMPAVTKKSEKPVVYRGPDNELGYLHPIKMKGLCVNCHGKTDQLAKGVQDMLARHYPKDEATGFEVGDLRGWFWVEVSGTDS